MIKVPPRRKKFYWIHCPGCGMGEAMEVPWLGNEQTWIDHLAKLNWETKPYGHLRCLFCKNGNR